jgi:hypothetical protein
MAAVSKSARFAFAATLVYAGGVSASVCYRILKAKRLTLQGNLDLQNLKVEFDLSADGSIEFYGIAEVSFDGTATRTFSEDEVSTAAEALQRGIHDAAADIIVAFATENPDAVVQAIEQLTPRKKRAVTAPAARADAPVKSDSDETETEFQFDPAKLKCTVVTGVGAFKKLALKVGEAFGSQHIRLPKPSLVE